jgi:hypothetical protein
MGRPSKYTPALGRELIRLAASGDHHSRAAIARAAGIGPRTFFEWVAAGRAGRSPFARWIEAFERAEAVTRRRRFRAGLVREILRSKARYQAFREARVRWWLATLGPRRFWARRLDWLAQKGLWDTYHRTAASL